MNNFKKARVLLMSFMLMGLFFLGINTVTASEGAWSSDGRVDFNGISEVGTSYTGGGNGVSHDFFLQVKYHPNGYSVGSATKTIEMDEMASHKCWGDPMFYKNGYVNPYNSGVSHLPWFDV